MIKVGLLWYESFRVVHTYPTKIRKNKDKLSNNKSLYLFQIKISDEFTMAKLA